MPKWNRRSIRLTGYDYSEAGAYFVTACTQGRECLFGEVIEGEMKLNDTGRMIQTVWDELPGYYPGVDTDEFILMPNHIHGIIILTPNVGAGPRACLENDQGIGQPRGVAPTTRSLSLPDVIHRFKSLTTARYRHGVSQKGWLPFPGKLWQRNYYEHIIRDENDLSQIRQYIQENPLKWDLDPENPSCPQVPK